MIVIGIDPGITGGMSQLGHRGEVLQCADIPVMVRSSSRVPAKGGGMRDKVTNQVNPSGLAEILREWTAGFDKTEVHVVIEKCQAMPGKLKGSDKAQSSAGTFSLGLSAGLIEGVVAALGLPHRIVHPATWKAALKLQGMDKNQVRAHAQRMYPQAPITRAKDHNRAEALLLAKYGQAMTA